MFSVLVRACLSSGNELVFTKEIDSFCVFLCLALSVSFSLGKHYTKPLCQAGGEEKQLPFQYKTPGLSWSHRDALWYMDQPLSFLPPSVKTLSPQETWASFD